jgi:membrane protein required for beta-lactamase induction
MPGTEEAFRKYKALLFTWLSLGPSGHYPNYLLNYIEFQNPKGLILIRELVEKRGMLHIKHILNYIMCQEMEVLITCSEAL